MQLALVSAPLAGIEAQLGSISPFGPVETVADESDEWFFWLAESGEDWKQMISFNRAVAVTPSDTVDIAYVPALGFDSRPTDALFIGGAGVVIVVFPDSSTCSYTVAANAWLFVQAIRVNNTSTTATAIVANWKL